ncbi:MAG: aldehyde dehydrogenase family protein, partial [Sphingomonadaceae bacterium]|nr:aldehyde dehydrogenase family protein [Sphingomonadaceae bacterium]
MLADFHSQALSLLPEAKLHIGGKTVAAIGGDVRAHINPANGVTTRSFAFGSDADVDAAVAAARAALPGFRAMGAVQRRDLLLFLATAFATHAERLSRIAVIENGMPMAFAPFVASATPVEWFRYYAGWVDKHEGGVAPMLDGDGLNYHLWEPYGVVAILIAFNAPMGFIGMKVAAALAAGNTVVIKPSELAPWSALAFAELCNEAGVPPGVVNVITGDGAAGSALVRHPGVDKVTFTGGGETAKAILTDAAQSLTPATLELGGKSAFIIFDDADIDKASADGVFASVA